MYQIKGVYQMEIVLNKKPQNVTIIEGFPGFGLVGTIASEFLIEHLDCELIGKFWFEDLPATIAIHEGKLIHPVGIYHNKKYNLVIVHAISGASGIEWKIASLINDLAKKLKAKEIISLEGVGSATPSDTNRVFYFSKNQKLEKKLKTAGLEPLNEGIIIGVTSAMMLKAEAAPLSCIFAETHSSLPDSKAAAKIVEALDKYLGLKVDYKPLIAMAEKFEEKLKTILQQSKHAVTEKEKKELSYVG